MLVVLGIIGLGAGLVLGSGGRLNEPLIVLLRPLLVSFLGLFLWEMFSSRKEHLFQQMDGNAKGARRRRFSRRERDGHARVSDNWSTKDPRV